MSPEKKAVRKLRIVAVIVVLTLVITIALVSVFAQLMATQVILSNYHFAAVGVLEIGDEAVRAQALAHLNAGIEASSVLTRVLCAVVGGVVGIFLAFALLEMVPSMSFLISLMGEKSSVETAHRLFGDALPVPGRVPFEPDPHSTDEPYNQL